MMDGKRISFQVIYGKLMKYVPDISITNLVTNRTINLLRFEGVLIQSSEIQEESLSIVSQIPLNLQTNRPIVPSGPYGMSCMYQ